MADHISKLNIKDLKQAGIAYLLDGFDKPHEFPVYKIKERCYDHCCGNKEDGSKWIYEAGSYYIYTNDQLIQGIDFLEEELPYSLRFISEWHEVESVVLWENNKTYQIREGK